MVLPQRTADPAALLALARRDGAAILTGIDTSTEEAVAAMSLEVMGDQARAVQTPIHVGTNNFGFRGGQKITNLDRRPAHVDSILDYGDKGHPDYFFLCCNIASSEGGGASYLIDLEDCLAHMEPWAAAALEDLRIVQKIELPPNYGNYALRDFDSRNELAVGQEQEEEEEEEEEQDDDNAQVWRPGSRAGARVEQLFARTAAGRKLLRVSSFSDAASLLEDMHADIVNLRPMTDSTSPERDMAVVRQWLHAVAQAEEEAPRFTLKEVRGTCTVACDAKRESGSQPASNHCPLTRHAIF